jgi:hypothetical protein
MSHLIPWGGGLSQKLTVDHLVNQFFNFFWTQVYYRVHNSPPAVPFLNLMHPVPASTFYFVKNHSNIILQSTSRFRK